MMCHRDFEQELFNPIPFKNNILEKYVYLYPDRFKASFREKHLEATIWYNNYIIAIFFNVTHNTSITAPIVKWQSKDANSFLKKIMSLGTEKITENLVIQKDIRGFEKDGFTSSNQTKNNSGTMRSGISMWKNLWMRC